MKNYEIQYETNPWFEFETSVFLYRPVNATPTQRLPLPPDCLKFYIAPRIDNLSVLLQDTPGPEIMSTLTQFCDKLKRYKMGYSQTVKLQTPLGPRKLVFTGFMVDWNKKLITPVYAYVKR